MKPNILNDQEVVGRTVAAVHETHKFVFLRMTDGSLYVVEARRDWDDGAEVVAGAKLSDADVEDLGRGLAIELGFTTAAEWDAKKAESEARTAAYRDQRDRAEFERLSKKFGTPEAK